MNMNHMNGLVVSTIYFSPFASQEMLQDMFRNFFFPESGRSMPHGVSPGCLKLQLFGVTLWLCQNSH